MAKTKATKGSRRGRPQVATRLDGVQIAELDRLAELASTPLREVTRSDVLRYAIELGIAQLREELEGKPAKPKRKAGRA